MASGPSDFWHGVLPSDVAIAARWEDSFVNVVGGKWAAVACAEARLY